MLRHYCIVKARSLTPCDYGTTTCIVALSILVGLLTGHADLKRHLALINVRSDALCPSRQEEKQSSLYFLSKYSATMRIRFELL